MRAGKLDKTITIQGIGEPTFDEYGGVQDSVSNDLTIIRAEIIQRTTTEFMQAQGANDENIIVFRIRYLADVTTANQVLFEEQEYNIREVVIIGRNRWMELRTEAIDARN